jgi:hypothetical protein
MATTPSNPKYGMMIRIGIPKDAVLQKCVWKKLQKE